MTYSSEKINAAISLHEFLREFVAANQKIVNNIKQQIWVKDFDAIPFYKDYVQIDYRDKQISDDDETGMADDAVLTVRKAEHTPFKVNPDSSFIDWLDYHWTNFEETPKLKETIVKNNQIERFEDNSKRVSDYDIWNSKREVWVEEQKEIQRVNSFFSELYTRYKDLELNSETQELMCGTAFLQCADNPDINHPILLKRLQLDFNAETNTIYLRDTTVPSELYTLLLSSITGPQDDFQLIDPSGVKKMAEMVKEQDYHPLDRVETVAFIKNSIHMLNPKSMILSDDEILTRELIIGHKEKLYVTIKPVIFIRKRLSGAANAIKQIIENIQQTGKIPPALANLIGDYQEIQEEEKVELTPVQMLAEVGGEDPDVLLPLPANREQLEIARRIERESAVLVQGPPGTGKTHTIANLIGNFLSQGKSVLVTSDTKKALTVLKDKLPPELQSLCVSLLDNNNRDMEKSIDGITAFMSANDSIGSHRNRDNAMKKREAIIKELAEVRQDIYDIKMKEFKQFTYRGENYSLEDMAKYVHDNRDKLSAIIPGKVKRDGILPVSSDELITLYSTNESITEDDEIEVEKGLPNPDSLCNPTVFSEIINKIHHTKADMDSLISSIGFTRNGSYLVKDDMQIAPQRTTLNNIRQLQDKLVANNFTESWMIKAIIDGSKGEGHVTVWQNLLEKIRETNEFKEAVYAEQITNTIEINPDIHIPELIANIEKLKELLSGNGKISTFQRLMNKKTLDFLGENVRINRHDPQSIEECEIVLNYIHLDELREETGKLWDILIGSSGEKTFAELDPAEPENQAMKYVSTIETCLEWLNKDYKDLQHFMAAAGLNPSEIITVPKFATDYEKLEAVFHAIGNTIPVLCEIQKCSLEYTEALVQFRTGKEQLLGLGTSSHLVQALIEGYSSGSSTAYRTAFSNLSDVYNKTERIENRRLILGKLKEFAPEWAAAISNRTGIHGETTVPDQWQDAIKWKQFDETVRFYNSVSFSELQKKQNSLSKDYRQATQDASKWAAWYKLLEHIEDDTSIQQALTGWKLTMKKIGKGTGKNAAKNKKHARELMKKCQKAVPVWIMTMNQVFDNLTPGDNHYDVAIIDEASQSDITSAIILNYAEKIIIVGDDKQVSPSAVGMELDKVNSLIATYIQDKIPNSHLFTTKTSLYDLALTTFKPLMLREHFRCVPPIINYSNILSYDGKIKPLRDQSSSNLLPPLISHNVNGHKQKGNVNIEEQEAILALLQACFDMPEYKNKTFGVISMLGDRQAHELQAKAQGRFSPMLMERHGLLFGNSAQFQGDEKDVIILSLVDSNEGEGPLSLVSEGADDSRKKRYNVAVSRAKDQLWVIHSLNKNIDLKSGDLRKQLLDYVDNPEMQNQLANIERESESPFEHDVAVKLTSRGYLLKQQWQVGSYRIDMVAIDGNRKIAIECDGERYHSGEDKIREDMERQTILERIGWNFIRIRGSEYYNDPEGTIDKVVERLSSYGVNPSTVDSSKEKKDGYELKTRVLTKMNEILADPSNEIIQDELEKSNHNLVLEELAKSSSQLFKEENIKKGDGEILMPLKGHDSTKATKSIVKTSPSPKPTSINKANQNQIKETFKVTPKFTASLSELES